MKTKIVVFLLYYFCIALPPNLACQTGVYNNSWIIVAGSTGSASTALNRLSSPQDVFIDGYNFIYVADYGNNRILSFPPSKYLY